MNHNALLKAKLQLHDHRAETVMRDIAMGNLYGCMQVLAYIIGHISLQRPQKCMFGHKSQLS